MKTTKKILSLLLCTIMIFGSVAIGGDGFVEVLDLLTVKASAEIIASGTCGNIGTNGDNLTWNLSNDGVLTISGAGDMANFSNSTAPWYSLCTLIKTVVIGSDVTSIGSSAFFLCSNLTSVTIPDGVTKIGDCAFYVCTGLTSIAIPDSVESIGEYAFDGCNNLTDVYYGGTEQQKANITIGDYDTALNNATWHYNHVHSFTETVTIAASCTEDGLLTYTCECGAYTKVIPACHDYIDHEAKAPTCEGIGWEAYQTCSRCDYNSYKEISALGHDYVNHKAKVPTCDEVGWDAYQTCSRCDYTSYKELSALGHDYVDGICTRCKDKTPERALSDAKAEAIQELEEAKKNAKTDEQRKAADEAISAIDNATNFSDIALIKNDALKEIGKDIFAGVKINVAPAETYDFRTIVTIKATATNVPDGYILALYVGDKVIKGTNKEVSCEYGELKSNINYTVKIVDKNGNVQKNADGKELSSESSVNVNKNFFTIIIAIFKGIFGTLPKAVIKPQ